MTERPILMSAPAVRPILAGTKTQTRRIVKPSVRDADGIGVYTDDARGVIEVVNTCDREPIDAPAISCPYGAPGDRLWVKETHARDGQLVAYEADGWAGAVCSDGGGGWLHVPHGFVCTTGADSVRRGDADKLGARYGLARYGGRWRPSIHMPRALSRITLEVTAVRVERLHDISEEDARAEGVEYIPAFRRWKHYVPERETPTQTLATARDSFLSLWEAINGIESLAANPWVWVVEFTRVKRAEAWS